MMDKICFPSRIVWEYLTSIMAVKYRDGVVLGADSRTSTGVYVANRVSRKISQLGDRVFCCRSGSAADTQAVADIVKKILSLHSLELGSLPDVHTAARLIQEVCYHNKDNLLAGMICAGWDPVKGGSVFSIPLGGTLIEQSFAIGGSGSTYIYGYCDAHFKKDMNREECKNFVKNALAHAMERDGSSGGIIRLVVVEKDGAEEETVPGDVLPTRECEALS